MQAAKAAAEAAEAAAAAAEEAAVSSNIAEATAKAAMAAWRSCQAAAAEASAESEALEALSQSKVARTAKGLEASTEACQHFNLVCHMHHHRYIASNQNVTSVGSKLSAVQNILTVGCAETTQPDTYSARLEKCSLLTSGTGS